MFIEHVNLTVENLETSIDFYTHLFGFSVRWRGTTSDGKAAAHVGDDHNYLALFQARDLTGHPSEPKSYDRVGFNHFGFVVDDLDALKERLATRNIQITEQQYNPGRHVYFMDPDGIEIEAVQYAQGESPIPESKENSKVQDQSDKSAGTIIARSINALRLGLDFSAPTFDEGMIISIH
ncbi:MAG: VOC family protein [Planctomycetota bacterium]|nr:VOC family protein [Planctomycetota bacterium]